MTRTRRSCNIFDVNFSDSNFSKAFSLIELMIVVAITGILASVAIPQFGKYIRKVKTTEAMTNLRKIYDGEIAYFTEDHVDQTGATLSKQFVFCDWQPDWTLMGIDKVQGNWEASGWPAIQFSADGPTQFTYVVLTNAEYDCSVDPECDPPSYDPTIPWYYIAASSDMDGDGHWSEFSRWGWFYQGELDSIPAIYTENPLE